MFPELSTKSPFPAATAKAAESGPLRVKVKGSLSSSYTSRKPPRPAGGLDSEPLMSVSPRPRLDNSGTEKTMVDGASGVSSTSVTDTVREASTERLPVPQSDTVNETLYVWKRPAAQPGKGSVRSHSKFRAPRGGACATTKFHRPGDVSTKSNTGWPAAPGIVGVVLMIVNVTWSPSLSVTLTGAPTAVPGAEFSGTVRVVVRPLSMGAVLVALMFTYTSTTLPKSPSDTSRTRV